MTAVDLALETFHPTIDHAGERMLARLRNHPHAPRFTNASGSRLGANDLAWVRRRSEEITTAEVPAGPPHWLDDFVARVEEVVPYFRAQARTLGRSSPFNELGTTDRATLAADVAQFVPDDVSLDNMIAYETSGVTGHPMQVPSHPIVAALYLAHHQRALRAFGVELRRGNDHVAAILLGMQERCFTYVSVVPMLGGAGFAKINLHQNGWRSVSDRSRYLNDLSPQLISGDPVSFAELLTMHHTGSLRVRPDALLSTSMAMSSGLRQTLEQRFECPVVDVYSCNETGPIAAFVPNLGGHVLLQPDLYVEIVDAAGRAVPEGERGEVAVTGGFNHMLALVRYRTGDYASKAIVNGHIVLRDLHGRAPVRFRAADGRWLNNHEIGHAIADVTLAQFTCHQHGNGSCTFAFDGPPASGLRAAEQIETLLGFPVRAKPTTTAVGMKMMQYTTNYPGGS